MMLFRGFFYSLLCLALFSCDNNRTTSSLTSDSEKTPRLIRKIERKTTDRLLRSTVYQMDIDSLHFSIEAGEREDSSVALRFNFYSTLSFQQHLHYQQLILEELANDYALNRTSSIFLGRLLYTGDLALQTTKEIQTANWDGSHAQLNLLLPQTEVVRAYQTILSPFGLTVRDVSIEKVMLAEKSSLLNFATITMPENEQPDRVLDGMLWLIF
jgi:hypothetical protein